MQRFMVLDSSEEYVERKTSASFVALHLTAIADDLLATYEKQRKEAAETAQFNTVLTLTLLSSVLLAVTFG